MCYNNNNFVSIHGYTININITLIRLYRAGLETHVKKNSVVGDDD
jgi:hypothetical protein